MLSFRKYAALCAAGLLLAVPAAVAAQATERCQVARTSPDGVRVERGGREAEAVVGLLLDMGDRITTVAQGRVTVQCDTGLTLTIGPDTAIELDRLMTPQDDSAGVRLLNGIAGFILGGGQERGFDVRTPSAVAAVRSTEWAMQVEDGATAAFVRDGAVAIQGATQRVVLTEGEGIDVTPAGALGPINSWGQARIDGFAERLGPDWRTPRRR